MTGSKKQPHYNEVADRLSINWQRMVERDGITNVRYSLLRQAQDLLDELRLFDYEEATRLLPIAEELYATMAKTERAYPKLHIETTGRLTQLVANVVKKLDDIAPNNYQFALHEASGWYHWMRDTGRPTNSALEALDITKQYCDTCCDWCVAGDLRVFSIGEEEVTLHTVCSTIIDWGFVESDELGVAWRERHPKQEATK